MVGNKRIKTDELKSDLPYRHLRPCPGDLRQPDDADRG